MTERLDFIRRDRHPTDRRKVVVVLDEAKVNEAMGGYYVEQGQALAGVLTSMTAVELETVRRFLVALTASAP